MTKDELKDFIYGRTKEFMSLPGLTKSDMEDSISEGIIIAGGSVATYGSATDDEVDDIADRKLILCVEVSWLEYLIDNMPLTKIKTGPVTENLNQLVEQLERKLERTKETLATFYGLFLEDIEFGSIDMGFAE